MVLLIPKLQSHFAEFLQYSSLKRLGILSLPTCVGLRYGHRSNSLRGFSWKHGINQFARQSLSSSLLRVNSVPDLPRTPPYKLEPTHPTVGWPTLLRPPFAQTLNQWYRNINLFSITYAFRPRLRDRLTLRRLALLRKPWAFGERVFHPLYRYSCQHGLFCPVQPFSRSTFSLNRMLPYRTFSSKRERTRSFGNALEPRYIFGADSLDQ